MRLDFLTVRLYRLGRLTTVGWLNYCTKGAGTIPPPLRSTKGKSKRSQWDIQRSVVDVKRLRAIGGAGGDGCVSLLSLWANANAGPDGGDGGSGGHVVLQASGDLRDLYDISSVVRAEDGETGGNNNCHGRNAKHTVIKVPVGTLVRDGKSGRVLCDLSEEGYGWVCARGGTGGRGNAFFTTDTQQTPLIAEYGAKGEDMVFILELRTIAHFGLLGMPNAGKSTLLQAMTRAKPKVAPYPFTTLRPHLGIVPYKDYTQIAVADLPGLIKGSHQGLGLGIDFLRHASRCYGLILVVDSASSEPSPSATVEMLRQELRLFSPQLADVPQFVVANKMDLPSSQENIKELIQSCLGLEVIPVSAKFGTNISQLLVHIRQTYDAQISPERMTKGDTLH